MASGIQLDSRTVQYFETGKGARIYQIPLTLFPFLLGYAYLVLAEDAGRSYKVLIDTGSGFGQSNQDLENGLQWIAEHSGEAVRLEDLTHVLITHGHIDHIGGLSYVRPRTRALIGIHELDLRIVINYEQSLAMASQRLCIFLHEAGVAENDVDRLIEMYNLMKSVSHSIPVDVTYEALGMHLGPFEILHVPGHSAGHVVFRLHDILFSGDHVLNDTSPHQSPEVLTFSTGLDHYLHSLYALQKWAGPVNMALGGHKGPIYDLNARLEAIRAMHYERLDRVMQLLETPQTISDVSHVLFGNVHGYNVLLALEETGAHVEYLYQRGQLKIVNLKELDYCGKPVPLYYQRLSPDAGLE